MFSSPLLSTRNQNEIFVFVPVFSSLRERKAPVSARPHRRARAKPNPAPHVRFARQNSLPEHPGTLAGGFERGESQAGRPRSKTRTPPLARRRRSGHIGEMVTPSQSRQVNRAKSVARSACALSRRDGRDSRGGRPALYIQRVVIRPRDGSMRRRNAPSETVSSPSRVWRVGVSAI
jgi:hypothetical protein